MCGKNVKISTIVGHRCFNPFSVRYVINAQDIIATNTGIHLIAASILFSLKTIVFLIEIKKIAAIIPPKIGDITQEAAILP